MQRFSRIEPGLLPAFRLFTGIRLTILLVNAGADVFLSRWSASILLIYLIGLADIFLLLVYLSWGRLQQVLKSWYLPVGIILATVGPIIELYVGIRISIDNISNETFFSGAWQLVLVLFIPLFITAWQYSMRQVVMFSVLTFVTEGLPIYVFGLSLKEAGLPRYIILPFLGILFVRTVSSLFIGTMVVKLMNTQRGLRSELSEANTRLAHYAGTLEQLTVSRERNRLARELHDVLAHTLSGVAVELEAVKALWKTNQAQAAEMVDHSLQATRAGLTETRRALHALRASPLEDLGLALAVRGLAESATGRTGLALETQIAENLPEYPPEVEQTAYRVAEEALRNASEHAGARCVRVALSGAKGSLELLVSDDGQGFDPGEVNPQLQFGLAGMRERAESVGGRLEIQTRPGGGTQVRLVYGAGL
jgi:signal transduction histidine kinase